MKIIDIICSAGKTGFYFDDQRAIKAGAGHDGFDYVGEPITEGFKRIRQAGESISVMFILEDGQVAQVFKDKLGDDINNEDWQEHIVILTKFWCMIGLQDTEYQGNPMRAHFDLPLSREKFGEWMVMFFQVIDTLYEPELGIMFKRRAENIASNFMRNLQL